MLTNSHSRAFASLLRSNARQPGPAGATKRDGGASLPLDDRDSKGRSWCSNSRSTPCALNMRHPELSEKRARVIAEFKEHFRIGGTRSLASLARIRS